MRKMAILVAAGLLLAMAMVAADATPASPGDTITVEASGATSSGSLQKPVITTVSLPRH